MTKAAPSRTMMPPCLERKLRAVPPMDAGSIPAGDKPAKKWSRRVFNNTLQVTVLSCGKALTQKAMHKLRQASGTGQIQQKAASVLTVEIAQRHTRWVRAGRRTMWSRGEPRRFSQAGFLAPVTERRSSPQKRKLCLVSAWTDETACIASRRIDTFPPRRGLPRHTGSVQQRAVDVGRRRNADEICVNVQRGERFNSRSNPCVLARPACSARPQEFSHATSAISARGNVASAALGCTHVNKNP
jgi:hypothetical protein